MKCYWFRSFLIMFLSFGVFATNVNATNTHPPQTLVRITTSLGNIDLELNAGKAPTTVKNFLSYVDEGRYNGTIFHRVMKGFMIQGGGYDEKLLPRKERKPIHNEADNGLKNTVGTIAMARTNEPHSASNQFFVNTVDNATLDHQSKTPGGWGYAVFGHVIGGLDVVKAIESTTTRSYGPFQNLPAKPGMILKISRIKP